MLVTIFKSRMLLSSTVVDPQENVYGKIHNVDEDGGIKDSLKQGGTAICVSDDRHLYGISLSNTFGC